MILNDTEKRKGAHCLAERSDDKGGGDDSRDRRKDDEGILER